MTRRPARLLRVFPFLALLLLAVLRASAADAWPATTQQWHGFPKVELTVDGRTATVVVPRTPAPGNPWVWHGEFFGHRPEPDIALLGLGFHIVYLSVPDMLGSPKAVAHWESLHTLLTTRHDLAKRPGLVGLSRGGLYVYNWAIAHPDKVACLYGDAPVCDFKSWPGGRGTGPGSKRDWQLVLSSYGFKSEAEALAFTNNPVDRLAPLAAARIPLLHVFGDADEVVPWTENTGLIAERYPKLGGEITLIRKPGVKHHPHGLDDVRPIVEFFWKNAGPAVVGRTPEERAAGLRLPAAPVPAAKP
jgi:pimeloyl-ACP methyl ester carboxylesterase